MFLETATIPHGFWKQRWFITITGNSNDPSRFLETAMIRHGLWNQLRFVTVFSTVSGNSDDLSRFLEICTIRNDFWKQRWFVTVSGNIDDPTRFLETATIRHGFWKQRRSVRFLETVMQCRGSGTKIYHLSLGKRSFSWPLYSYYEGWFKKFIKPLLLTTSKVEEMKQMERIEFEMCSFRVQNFHLRSSNQQILTWSILLAFSLVLWNSIITPSLVIW